MTHIQEWQLKIRYKCSQERILESFEKLCLAKNENAIALPPCNAQNWISSNVYATPLELLISITYYFAAFMSSVKRSRSKNVSPASISVISTPVSTFRRARIPCRKFSSWQVLVRRGTCDGCWSMSRFLPPNSQRKMVQMAEIYYSQCFNCKARLQRAHYLSSCRFSQNGSSEDNKCQPASCYLDIANIMFVPFHSHTYGCTLEDPCLAGK